MTQCIYQWQQSNSLSITLHGHSKNIPIPSATVTADEFDIDVFNSKNSPAQLAISQLSGTDTYNKIYDSFFAPADFKLSAITLRLPKSLPTGVTYQVSIRINGAESEAMSIPENQLENIIIYGEFCDIPIWEDDYIEIDVTYGSGESLSWNDHNMTAAISGCIYYKGYESIFPAGKIKWNQGDAFYKTNITLYNRSGNDLFSDRCYADIVKSPISFLLQGIRLSMFEDLLMTDLRYDRGSTCFYASILINGKNLNANLGLSDPVSIESVGANLKSYSSGIYNDVAGYPVFAGDDILIKIYQKNHHAKFNGKILQLVLFGCGSDCINAISSNVTIYELCGLVPCEPKFATGKSCEPTNFADGPNKQNPILK